MRAFESRALWFILGFIACFLLIGFRRWHKVAVLPLDVDVRVVEKGRNIS